MTLFLASLWASLLVGLESGGAAAAEESMNWTPYLAGGISLAILFASLIALLIFGKGREHS